MVYLQNRPAITLCRKRLGKKQSKPLGLFQWEVSWFFVLPVMDTANNHEQFVTITNMYYLTILNYSPIPLKDTLPCKVLVAAPRTSASHYWNCASACTQITSFWGTARICTPFTSQCFEQQSDLRLWAVFRFVWGQPLVRLFGTFGTDSCLLRPAADRTRQCNLPTSSHWVLSTGLHWMSRLVRCTQFARDAYVTCIVSTQPILSTVIYMQFCTYSRLVYPFVHLYIQLFVCLSICLDVSIYANPYVSICVFWFGMFLDLW